MSIILVLREFWDAGVHSVSAGALTMTTRHALGHFTDSSLESLARELPHCHYQPGVGNGPGRLVMEERP